MGKVEFKMPDIGEGVAEGEITSWKVKAGDAVTEDQVMVEVMTDKATVEIGSPVTGEIVELKAKEGETVPVGSVIVVLAEGKASGKAPAAKKEEKQEEPKKTAPAPAPSGDLEEVNFALPDIGEGVAEGEITKWMVAEGDTVAEDQPMLEVMTDKATVEIGSPVDGKVVSILVKEGSTVPVGEVLLVLGAASGAAPKIVSHAPVAATASAGSTAVADPPRTGKVRAAPATRRLARELDVDIASVAGSGPNGRVTMDDVRAAVGKAPAPAAPKAAAPAPSPAPAPKPVALQGDTREPLKGLRKRIAVQMRAAKHTAAHFMYAEEIDVTELVKLRTAAKPKAEAAGAKLTYMPFLIKAIIPALREFPLMNASLDEEAQEIVYHGDLNIGIAVETPAGLIVPVVRQVDHKSMFDIAREIAELSERARSGKTKQDDIGGGTFTITNAGNIGGVVATPIINVPEVAIMGVHQIKKRPWVVDNQIVIRDIMWLSLSLDHRVVDGAVGARFMNRVQELLENPGLLLFEER